MSYLFKYQPLFILLQNFEKNCLEFIDNYLRSQAIQHVKTMYQYQIRNQLLDKDQVFPENNMSTTLQHNSKYELRSMIKIESADQSQEKLRIIETLNLKTKNQGLTVIGNKESLVKPPKITAPILKPEENNSCNTIEKRNLDNFNCLKGQISDLVFFFIRAFCKITQREMEQQRIKLSHSGILVDVFDALNKKYSFGKYREDMVRICIRKALSFMKNTFRTELNLNTKQASLTLCKKYFQKESDMMKNKSKVDIQEMENEIINFFLPDKKNSRNKTPNARFIDEAFMSEDFFRAYLSFLSKFDEIMQVDNQKKIDKLVEFIYNCILKNTINKV